MRPRPPPVVITLSVKSRDRTPEYSLIEGNVWTGNPLRGSIMEIWAWDPIAKVPHLPLLAMHTDSRGYGTGTDWIFGADECKLHESTSEYQKLGAKNLQPFACPNPRHPRLPRKRAWLLFRPCAVSLVFAVPDYRLHSIPAWICLFLVQSDVW